MLISVIIMLAIILADRLVKYWALTALAPVGDMAGIKGIFHFFYVENEGAAFSIFSQQKWLLIILPSVIVLAALYVLFFKKLKWPYTVCLAFIAAGGVGNLIDRIVYGYVVDMFAFDFVNFAIFNVADIFITLGGIGLVVVMLFFDKDKELFEIGKKKEEVIEQDAAPIDDN